MLPVFPKDLVPQDIDPYRNNVILHIPGEDNLYSTKGPFSIVGGVTLDSTYKPFGEKSLYFNGSTGYIQVNNSPSVQFGTEDWTFETWIRMNASGTNPTTVFYITWGPGCIFCTVRTGGGVQVPSIEIYDGAGGVYRGAGTGNLFDSNWHHLAYSRHNGIFYLHVDGILNITFAGYTSYVVGTGTSLFYVGNSLSNRIPACSMKEIRVTKGVSRYKQRNFPIRSVRKPHATIGTFS